MRTYLHPTVVKQAATEFDLQPNDPGQGAMLGAGLGATLGLGTGVVSAFRKKKTLGQAILDALEDTAIGGAGGAALGGLAAAGHRALDGHELREALKGRVGVTDKQISDVASERRIPLVASLKHAIGLADDAELEKAKRISNMHTALGITARTIDPDALYDAESEANRILGPKHI